MKNMLVKTLALALLTAGVLMAFAPAALAHNRAQIELPNGDCIVVGSLKSVTLPDGTNVDLRPETPQDEIGAAFAANQGRSRIEIGGCA